MRNLLKQVLDHLTEIIVGIFILAIILEMAKLLIQRIENYFYKEVVYVYACPQDTKSSKCYKVRADMASVNDDGFERWYVERINFKNGGFIYFKDCDFFDKKYTCYPEKDDDGIWNLQISEVVKVKK